MNRTLSNVLIFTAGLTTGSLVTWKLVKTKYERICQEEIDSVKEVFLGNKRDSDVDVRPEEETHEPVKENVREEYSNYVDNLGYTHYEEKGEADTTDDEPEIISPDEFGSINYETEYLSYYADRVLADEVDDVVEDVEGTVGSYSLTRFGEYEDEIVHVRNHKLRIDYEITLDSRSYYEDIKGVSPADE